MHGASKIIDTFAMCQTTPPVSPELDTIPRAKIVTHTKFEVLFDCGGYARRESHPGG
jgi:hypothetical protein